MLDDVNIRFVRSPNFRSCLTAVCMLFAVLLNGQGKAAPKPMRVGFLAAELSLEAMGPHNRAGWHAAGEIGAATLLFRRADGAFVDGSGKVRNLNEFDVVWYHQGDAIRRTALYRPPAINTIRRFAEDGGGVLLSGGALAMVAQLGLEREIRPQRHDLGPYRDPAGMIPVETEHPAFSGFTCTGGVIGLSGGGCRAVADFNWGGPAEGMVLARTEAGRENPLVEYTLGRGRLIVFGGRWPDFADRANPHRRNLMRLTANLLRYLSDASSWQRVLVRSRYPNADAEHPEEVEVSAAEYRSLERAVSDLSNGFPGSYQGGRGFLERLAQLRSGQSDAASPGTPSAHATRQAFEALKREALLANPLLDFGTLLMIRRRADRLGLPLNFNGNTDLAPGGYGNTLVALSPVRPGGRQKTIYTPEGDRFIGDIDLHYSADRLLFSAPDEKGRWGIGELNLATGRVRRLELIEDPDVHNYDACYLPDGRIVFSSTATFTGVPCVGGRSKVANLYLRERDGGIRRLTNDQDHNWCPTVLNNGQLLYQRWEYTDIAHAFTRLLFHANPDGSRQMEYYGSNSFWPTALFYARAVPDHPTRVVAVVGGHHDAPRQGELVLLDPALGRQETDGVVQRIPGFGEKVEPVILDGLIGNSWPRFLHPFPLSDKYFIVSCKPSKTSLWGVYLVDVFDNYLCLAEVPGFALLEPVPLRKTKQPPVIPDVVDPERNDASVYMMDVYEGNGLRGVPRGSVKSLRIVSYEFTFHGLGCEPYRVGFDGPWDVRRILGTVPVASDGSAYFTVPACTPVALQPLDAEGKALALMRSWFTAVPGEVLSCVGCHEPQNTTPPVRSVPLALRRPPSPITPWYGPPRGFSFEREVQPVLDAYCVDCHNGSSDAGSAPDFSARPAQRIPSAFQMHFTPSYMALRRFVHAHTLESDAHLLPPMAFHADTSTLVQMLRDGHYGVQLSAEAWDRLITWIDLNAPAHGTWQEVVAHLPGKAALARHGAERRRELNRRYAGIDKDPEAIYPPAVISAEPPRSAPTQAPPVAPKIVDVPAGKPGRSGDIRTIDIAPGVSMELVRIQPGAFVMGSNEGYPNERPERIVRIDAPFWLGRCEVTNRQYNCFDPHHDSGLVTGEQYQFGDYERGHRLSRPEQPVVRVSWTRAMAFCRWLSKRTKLSITLPTEAQWEYACRGGTTTSLSYGTLDDDFSRLANLSDATHRTVDYPHVPTALPPWRPAETRFDDGRRVSAPVGSFRPNSWGLHDMHGNVAEWTLSAYRPYPFDGFGQGGDVEASNRKTVRGGSWRTRPRRARSSFRLHYRAWQPVCDVGFRVVCLEMGSARCAKMRK